MELSSKECFQFSVPHLDYLWDYYYRIPIHFVRATWHFKTAIMRGEMVGPERTKAWYHIIILTEILKMRGMWNKVEKKPLQKGGVQ